MKPQKSGFIRIRHRIEWLFLVLLQKAVALLPLAVVRALAKLLAKLAWFADGRGRRVALENLRLAFKDLPEQERQRIAQASYAAVARTTLELFWSSRLRAGHTDSHWSIDWEDEQAVRTAAEKGVVFITPHYRNFEWEAMAWGLEGQHMTIIAEEFKNPLLTPFFTRERRRVGHHIIAQKGALRRLLRCLESGDNVALLPDLTTPPRNTAAIIQCFGRPISVTTLPTLLAIRTDRPVVPAICLLDKNNRYCLKVFRPIQFAKDTPVHVASQTCWDVFESAIRKNPDGWLWMYKHWRYRPKDGDPKDYPFYANVSKAFDKLAKTQNKDA